MYLTSISPECCALLQGVHIEGLSREAGALSEQQRAAIVADAPELAGLLQELRDALEEIRTRLGPLLAEVCCHV